MRHILYKYLTGASLIALTFSLNTGTANATCSAMPSCESMGYTQTSCNGGSSIKCPFDTTKLRCTSCTGHYNLVDGRCEDWECGVGQAQKFSTTCPNAYCPYRCYCGKSEYCYVISNNNEDACINMGYTGIGHDCMDEDDVDMCPLKTEIPYCISKCPPSCNFDDCKFYKRDNGNCVEATCQELGYTIAYADVPENLREGLDSTCICDYSNGYAPTMAAWVKPSCVGEQSNNDPSPTDPADNCSLNEQYIPGPFYANGTNYPDGTCASAYYADYVKVFFGGRIEELYLGGTSYYYGGGFVIEITKKEVKLLGNPLISVGKKSYQDAVDYIASYQGYACDDGNGPYCTAGKWQLPDIKTMQTFLANRTLVDGYAHMLGNVVLDSNNPREYWLKDISGYQGMFMLENGFPINVFTTGTTQTSEGTSVNDNRYIIPMLVIPRE